MQRTLAALAVIITTALVLAGCASTTHTAPHKPHFRELGRPQLITVAAYGDSITAWTPGEYVVPTWVTHLSAHLQFTGQGWAGGGAKLDRILSNARPITADVLVIAAGTNDEGDRWGTPMEQRLAEVKQLVQISDPKRVVLDAVPPRDLNPAWSDGWNAQLQQLAAQEGWHYFDPWSFLRSPDGHYLPGTTIEGIHPTQESQARAGAAISAYLQTVI